MKKLLISLIALVALSAAAQAQNNTFGLRLGYGAAFGGELSYQGFVSDINRIELDLGARFGKTTVNNDGVQVPYPTSAALSLIYQWHWFLVGGFGIYGGPGVQATATGEGFGLGLGAQAGFDYQFDAPFQLSVDFRPIYHLIGPYAKATGSWAPTLDPHVAVGIRYAF